MSSNSFSNFIRTARTRFVSATTAVVLMAGSAGASLPLLLSQKAYAASDTTVVRPNDLHDWLFYNDETEAIDNSLGSFVVGPATPPAGIGSAQVSVSGSQRKNLATYQFAGTALSDITELKYSTYNPSAGNGEGAGSDRSGYLQFNVSFDGADTCQLSCVTVPLSVGR